MKIILLITAAITIATQARAQWNQSGTNVYYNGGNVGILTATPQKNLDVVTGLSNFVSFGDQLGISNYGGIHFGYLEYGNSLYRKSALVFERLDGAARGKIHLLNNADNNPNSATLADSKFTIDYTGNVGIGNPSPFDKVQIGSEGFLTLKVGRWATLGETGSALATIIGNNVRASPTSNSTMEFITTTGDGAKAIKLQYNEGISFHTYHGTVTAGQAFTGYERMRINNEGNVGIGNISPEDKLQIGIQGFLNLKVGRWAAFGETGSAYATIIGNNVKASQTTNSTMEFVTTTADGAKAIKMQYNEGISFHTYQGSVTAGQAFTGYERMRIDNNGNVGIGTISPDAKLTVKGTIHTQEVKVDLQGAVAPDYVFEKDYPLPSLEEVEAYITTNKHLPEIPSASEMEENGMNLKEMNLLLLKKVEELTLYVIELKKENIQIKEQISGLKNQN